LENTDFSTTDLKGLQITIVGLGLMGGSYAMALRRLNPLKIWAMDIDRAVLQKAEKEGIIDGGFSQGKGPLPGSDVVLICLYPRETVRFVRENMAYFKKGALLTDSAGLKEEVIREVKTFLRPDLDFVGGHPLAGREGSGFSRASADIFKKANYLLTPVAGNRAQSLNLLKQMIKGIGSRPIEISPAEHDAIIALTSHLPHVLAAALMNSSPEAIRDFTGGSFRDATRVADMNARLWSELFLANKKNVLTQIKIFEDNINKIKNALQEADGASLQKLLETAAAAREKF